MNCKQGDLAVIVAPYNPANLGRIVRVVAPIGYMRAGTLFTYEGRVLQATITGFYWWTEGPVVIASVGSSDGRLYPSNHSCDSQLRPIRDPGDDAVDEVVQQLGKPAQSDTLSERDKENAHA